MALGGGGLVVVTCPLVAVTGGGQVRHVELERCLGPCSLQQNEPPQQQN